MARRQRSTLDKFLEQEKAPIFTAVSLLTTVVVWVVVIADILYKPHDPVGPLARFYILILLLLVGLLINAVVGGIAASRGEYCGGRIAAVGIALWLVTTLLLYRNR
jgi:hypothetical protein